MFNAHSHTLTPIIKISRDNRNGTQQSLKVSDKYLKMKQNSKVGKKT